MKLKFKGLKIEVEEFEMEESLHPNTIIGYRKAITQIALLIKSGKDVTEIENELNSLHDYPKL